MCALFGFLDYGHKLPVRVLQRLVQLLANASEVRGSHACGIAYNQGNQLTIYKRPKTAHKLHLRIPKGTSAVMGHTRFTTQGSEKQNYNNHPFRGTAGTAFALAHNGVLYNDRSLRCEKHLPETRIETDSYVAVQLLEQHGKLDFDSLRNMAEDVSGNFVFTLLDADNSLWFVKGDNPLYILHFPELGLYIYASTEDIMHTALCNMVFMILPHEVIAIDEGELMHIDPDGTIERSTFRPSYYIPRLRWSLEDLCGLDDAAEEDDSFAMLVDMAGYFGITEDEVRYMREMGYSYDEIEEFLMVPGAYETALLNGEI